MYRYVRNIEKAIVTILLILLACVSITIGYKFVDPFNVGYETIDFMGYQNRYIKTGSMSPTINVGDLMIEKLIDDTSELEVGDIAAYTINVKDEYEKDTLVVHRIIGKDENGNFLFKGDANDNPDFAPVSPDRIQSVPVIIIPKLGFVLAKIRTLPGFALLLTSVFAFSTLWGGIWSKLDDYFGYVK